MWLLLLIFLFDLIEFEEVEEDENKFIISETPLETDPFDDET